MRRFLRIRILFVLIALLLVPALALPFAERLRAEWARYWQPHIEAAEERQFASMETLRLLEELEQADYVRRARLGRTPRSGLEPYSTPVLEPGCLFRDPEVSEPASFSEASPQRSEAAAKQERFLRSFYEAEELLRNEKPMPDVFIGYPDAARSAEIAAEIEQRENLSASHAAER